MSTPNSTTPNSQGAGAASGTARFVTLDEIRAARERIRPIAKVTPLVDVSDIAGRSLSLKCESLQPGGAFKIRGAYNMVAQLPDGDRRKGVITYSSGTTARRWPAGTGGHQAP